MKRICSIFGQFLLYNNANMSNLNFDVILQPHLKIWRLSQGISTFAGKYHGPENHLQGGWHKFGVKIVPTEHFAQQVFIMLPNHVKIMSAQIDDIFR